MFATKRGMSKMDQTVNFDKVTACSVKGGSGDLAANAIVKELGLGRPSSSLT